MSDDVAKLRLVLDRLDKRRNNGFVKLDAANKLVGEAAHVYKANDPTMRILSQGPVTDRDFLYHASGKKFESLDPSYNSKRSYGHEYTVPVVFAGDAPSSAFAANPTAEYQAIKDKIKNSVYHRLFDELTGRKALLGHTPGGYLYKLPASAFTRIDREDNELGKWNKSTEYVSHRPVKPISVTPMQSTDVAAIPEYEYLGEDFVGEMSAQQYLKQAKNPKVIAAIQAWLNNKQEKAASAGAGVFTASGNKVQGVGLRKLYYSLLAERGLTGAAVEAPMNMYTYIPSGSIEHVKKHGLLSGNELAKPENRHLLDIARPDGEADRWLKERDARMLKSPWTNSYNGPSAFFGEVDSEKIHDKHPIKKFNATRAVIKLRELLRDYPATKMEGSELIPFSDTTYDTLDEKGKNEFVNKRHHTLSSEEIKALLTRGQNPKDMWKDFKDTEGKYYAADVPHAQVVTPMGKIPSKYIYFGEADMRKNAPAGAKLPLEILKSAAELDKEAGITDIVNQVLRTLIKSPQQPIFVINSAPPTDPSNSALTNLGTATAIGGGTVGVGSLAANRALNATSNYVRAADPFDPTLLQRVDTFNSKFRDPTATNRQMVLDYATHGSDLVKGPVLSRDVKGVTGTTGYDIIKQLRTSKLPMWLARQLSSEPLPDWDAGLQHHYDSFNKSPLTAYNHMGTEYLNKNELAQGLKNNLYASHNAARNSQIQNLATDAARNATDQLKESYKFERRFRPAAEQKVDKLVEGLRTRGLLGAEEDPWRSRFRKLFQRRHDRVNAAKAEALQPLMDRIQSTNAKLTAAHGVNVDSLVHNDFTRLAQQHGSEAAAGMHGELTNFAKTMPELAGSMGRRGLDGLSREQQLKLMDSFSKSDLGEKLTASWATPGGVANRKFMYTNLADGIAAPKRLLDRFVQNLGRYAGKAKGVGLASLPIMAGGAALNYFSGKADVANAAANSEAATQGMVDKIRKALNSNVLPSLAPEASPYASLPNSGILPSLIGTPYRAKQSSDYIAALAKQAATQAGGSYLDRQVFTAEFKVPVTVLTKHANIIRLAMSAANRLGSAVMKSPIAQNIATGANNLATAAIRSPMTPDFIKNTFKPGYVAVKDALKRTGRQWTEDYSKPSTLKPYLRRWLDKKPTATSPDSAHRLWEQQTNIMPFAMPGQGGAYYPKVNIAQSSFPQGTENGMRFMRHELAHGLQFQMPQPIAGGLKSLHTASKGIKSTFLQELNAHAAMSRNPLGQMGRAVSFAANPAALAAYWHRYTPIDKLMHGTAAAVLPAVAGVRTYTGGYLSPTPKATPDATYSPPSNQDEDTEKVGIAPAPYNGWAKLSPNTQDILATRGYTPDIFNAPDAANTREAVRRFALGPDSFRNSALLNKSIPIVGVGVPPKPLGLAQRSAANVGAAIGSFMGARGGAGLSGLPLTTISGQTITPIKGGASIDLNAGTVTPTITPSLGEKTSAETQIAFLAKQAVARLTTVG